MEGITSSRIMDLKSTLQVMVDKNLMQEEEMINILNKAGLSKSTKECEWVDLNGNKYNFTK